MILSMTYLRHKVIEGLREYLALNKGIYIDPFMTYDPATLDYVIMLPDRRDTLVKVKAASVYNIDEDVLAFNIMECVIAEWINGKVKF